MTNGLIIEDLTLVAVPVWWQSAWFITLVILLLAIGGFFLVFWWRNRPHPHSPMPPGSPPPPPHLDALRRLLELRTNHAQLEPYAVAIECSDVLRIYIEARFGLPIRYQTTREFLGSAQSAPELTLNAREQLGEFLKFFDHLKFARAHAAAEETLAAIDGAEGFVRRCIPTGPKDPA